MAHPLELPTDTADLIQRIDLAAQKATATAICDEVKTALVDLGESVLNELPPTFLRGTPDQYSRRLLHKCSNQTYSVMVMVWQPGQGTPVHDHAGKWCVETVLQGQIEIVAFDPVGDPTADTCGFTPTGTVVGPAGSVGAYVPPNEYHLIRNVSSETAVTMHVYAGEMLWCHAFHEREPGVFHKERRTLEYTS